MSKRDADDDVVFQRLCPTSSRDDGFVNPSPSHPTSRVLSPVTSGGICRSLTANATIAAVGDIWTEFRNFRSMSFGVRRLVTKRLRIDVTISFRDKRRWFDATPSKQ